MTVKKMKEIYARLEQIQSEISDIHAAAQDVLDKKSAKWQESEKGEILVNRISYLEDALLDINSLMSNLDEASCEAD